MPPDPSYEMCVNRRVELYHWMPGGHTNSINNLVTFIVQTKKQSPKKNRPSRC